MSIAVDPGCHPWFLAQNSDMPCATVASKAPDSGGGELHRGKKTVSTRFTISPCNLVALLQWSIRWNWGQDWNGYETALSYLTCSAVFCNILHKNLANVTSAFLSSVSSWSKFTKLKEWAVGFAAGGSETQANHLGLVKGSRRGGDLEDWALSLGDLMPWACVWELRTPPEGEDSQQVSVQNGCYRLFAVCAGDGDGDPYLSGDRNDLCCEHTIGETKSELCFSFLQHQ